MSWSLSLAGLALLSFVGVVYPFQAPGDRFAASQALRRRAKLALAGAVVIVLGLLLTHGQLDAAIVGFFLSLSVGGVVVCFMRAMGAGFLVVFGSACLAGALITKGLGC